MYSDTVLRTYDAYLAEQERVVVEKKEDGKDGACYGSKKRCGKPFHEY